MAGTSRRALFAERGFHGASLKAIAEAAGYTTGAIYAHFRGKDDLFLAAYEQYALTRVEELRALDETVPGPLPRRARAFADHWMARHADDPRFTVVALEFLVHAWRDPDLRAALATRHAAVRLAVANVLEREARSQGAELPLPAHDLATVLRELGVGLALAKLSDPGAFADRLYGDFVELFLELALERAP